MAWTNAEPGTLMERVLAPANLRRAYQRVVRNKGAPGADGMTVDQLAGYVKQYWPTLKARLLAGEYHPQGVRAVDIQNQRRNTAVGYSLRCGSLDSAGFAATVHADLRPFVLGL